MSTINAILETMGWVVSRSPLMVVYVLGIIIAVARYRRHPRVSLLTLFALVGLLFLSVFMPFDKEDIPNYLSSIQTVVGVDTAFHILSFVHSFLAAVLFLLLLVAVFSGRSQRLGIRGADGQYLPPDFLTRQEQR
ncbi:MAG TPA: hypothetical protein VGY66_35360 [Gemmataceae bacterium]|jgi:uncharacterized membrane protein YozB (DUF420 family)|nr:hypothetical protein [Gemmataceae bacterium]